MKILAAWSRLAPRERRTIMLAIALTSGAWLMLRGVPRIVREARLAQERATLATTSLDAANMALMEEPAGRESLAVLGRELVALAPCLLSGSPSQATAELSSLAGGAAALRQVTVVAQESRPDSAASIFTRVTLRLQADGDAAGIGGWLADLEEGKKLIRIRSLTLGAADPTATGTEPERLHAEVVLEGWSQGPRATQ